jgi:hypothetical protein
MVIVVCCGGYGKTFNLGDKDMIERDWLMFGIGFFIGMFAGTILFVWFMLVFG